MRARAGFGLLVVFILYGWVNGFSGNAIAFACPTAKVYELAAFAAERSKIILIRPLHRFFTVWAVDAGSLCVHFSVTIPKYLL